MSRTEPLVAEYCASPLTVRLLVERALERRAKAAADAIHIEIVEGTVVLSGVVPTWADREIIEEAAQSAPGVRLVDNQLHLPPF
jgi:osmotically-inducible protein OsmY